jgi:hypothetical protein
VEAIEQQTQKLVKSTTNLTEATRALKKGTDKEMADSMRLLASLMQVSVVNI